MTSWNLEQEQGSFTPDIKFGLHEHCLREVPYGPTQASRVLEQSHMLEQAHERRFAFSELGDTRSSFGSEHTTRIQQCLDMLSKQFEDHPRPDTREPHPTTNDALTGLLDGSHESFHCPDLASLSDLSQPATLQATVPCAISTPALADMTPLPMGEGAPSTVDMERTVTLDDTEESLEQSIGFIPRAGRTLLLQSVRQPRAVRYRRNPMPYSASGKQPRSKQRKVVKPGQMAGLKSGFSEKGSRLYHPSERNACAVKPSKMTRSELDFEDSDIEMELDLR